MNFMWIKTNEIFFLSISLSFYVFRLLNRNSSMLHVIDHDDRKENCSSIILCPNGSIFEVSPINCSIWEKIGDWMFLDTEKLLNWTKIELYDRFLLSLRIVSGELIVNHKKLSFHLKVEAGVPQFGPETRSSRLLYTDDLCEKFPGIWLLPIQWILLERR